MRMVRGPLGSSNVMKTIYLTSPPFSKGNQAGSLLSSSGQGLKTWEDQRTARWVGHMPKSEGVEGQDLTDCVQVFGFCSPGANYSGVG